MRSLCNSPASSLSTPANLHGSDSTVLSSPQFLTTPALNNQLFFLVVRIIMIRILI